MSKPKEARLKGLQMHPLSKAIDGHNDDGKVSLVQRSISRIDRVNAKHHAITTLYLSGNFITTLDNIGQFPQLRVLSLASNNIESVQTLRLLSQLPHLQNLCLTGNPVSQHPLYRTFCIGHSPRLKTLDNSPISPSTLHQSTSLLSQLNGKFTRMIQNYWTMVKLCRFARTMQIHKQVNRKARCCTRERLEVFMRVCKVGGGEGKVWDSLSQDCMVIYLTMEDSQQYQPLHGFLRAVDMLIYKQKEKIRELRNKLEAKIQREGERESDEELSDTELFSEIQSRVGGTIKAKKYRELNLKLVGFLALKHNRQTTRKHKQRCQTNIDIGCQLLSQLVSNVKKIFFGKLRKVNQNSSPYHKNKVQSIHRSMVKKAVVKMKEKVKSKQKVNYENMETVIREKRQRKGLLRKYLFIWRDQYQKKLIENNTKELYLTFEQMKKKQSKYLKKIELLHQYVQVIKTQHYKDKQQLRKSRQTQRSRQILIKDSSRMTNRRTYDSSPSPLEQYSPKRTRQKSSPSQHTYRPETAPYSSVEHEYFTSDLKENRQRDMNLGRTRQRVLNKRDEFQDIHTSYECKRKQILSRVQRLN